MGKKRPVIGIDASRAVGRIRTGTENYSAQIIRGLVSQPLDGDWRIYFNGHADDLDLPEVPNIERRNIPAPRLWTHVRLSRELMLHRVSGLFVPAHVVPLYHPPAVVTIHDLGYLHWPETHPKNQVRMLDMTTRWSARAARHIIVPSQQTANDLVGAYHVSADKITVVHHGIDPAMKTQPDHSDTTLRERYNLPGRFVLAVGTMQPRKNLGTLAVAMALLTTEPEVHLVIAGRKGWMHDQVEKDLAAANLGDRLHILDYIPSVDLPALYRAAEIFVQPSRFEGFGMPILEAMACGTPVIAARGSSLDEIGGDAALRFNADDATELAFHITSLLADPAKKLAAAAAGTAWSQVFNWEQAVRKTRIVLEESLLS